MHIFPQWWGLLVKRAGCRMCVNFGFWGLAMLFATVSRGRKTGKRLVPHLFQDNRYRVQLGKRGPYIPVPDYREIPSYLANGYSLLMSDKAGSQTPSLIRPQSVRGWSVDSRDLFFPIR